MEPELRQYLDAVDLRALHIARGVFERINTVRMDFTCPYARRSHVAQPDLQKPSQSQRCLQRPHIADDAICRRGSTLRAA
jgi:hypothetical protein